MKKVIFSILLVATLVFSVTSTGVFAANDKAMSVSYTYSSHYVINIPASISINESGITEITASSVSIGPGKTLAVFLDNIKTYANGGNFYLYKDKGTENEKKITCSVMRATSGGSSWENITGLGERVASFRDGDTKSYEHGALKFMPDIEMETEYGTYTGTVYFFCDVVDI